MSPYKPNNQQVLCLLAGNPSDSNKPIHATHRSVGELNPA